MVIQRRNQILIVTLISGAGGMVGQLLLLRELTVIHAGNELAIGIVLASWLVLEATGAFLAGLCKKKSDILRGLHALLMFLYALALPAAMFFSRFIDQALFGAMPGEAAGLGTILASAWILTGISLVHGAMFPLACMILRRLHGDEKAAGKIYLFENLGGMIAGIAFSLHFVLHFPALSIGLGISLLHLAGGLMLLTIHLASVWRRLILGASSLLLIAIAVWGLDPLSQALRQESLQRQWPGHSIEHEANTPHGNIVVTRRQDTDSYFYDGRLMTSVPGPDLARIEDYVHLCVLAHPDPRQALIIGGMDGMVQTLQKHPLESLTIAELDPNLWPLMLERHESLSKAMEDPRLKLLATDGRRHLAEGTKRYDLILLGFITPESLQENRLFTREFFDLVAQSLQPGGIFAFTAPGTMASYPSELHDLSASLHRTLEGSFAHTHFIAGEDNLFLASDQPLTVSASILARRQEQRSLDLPLLSQGYWQHRLDPHRSDRALQSMAQSPARVNLDFHPTAFSHALVHWGRLTLPQSGAVFRSLGPPPALSLLAALLIWLLMVWRVGRNRKDSPSLQVHHAIWSSGVTGMSLDVLLLLAFQSLFGIVYQMSGLLIATFMGGALLGGLVGMQVKKDPRSWFLRLEGCLVGLPLVLFAGLSLARTMSAALPQTAGVAWVLVLAILAGFFSGSQFPLAAKMLQTPNRDVGGVSGSLYAVDLLGGFIGGLLVTTLLFPLLGLFQTLLGLGILKAGSFLLLFSQQRALREVTRHE